MSSIASEEQVRRETSSAGGEPELSVVLPCLNEARTLPACIAQIQRAIGDHHINAEIIVADNGSTDAYSEIGASLGARVAPVPDRGYDIHKQDGIERPIGKRNVPSVVCRDTDFGCPARQFLDSLDAQIRTQSQDRLAMAPSPHPTSTTQPLWGKSGARRLASILTRRGAT